MPAHRCSLCAINYPYYKDLKLCDICGEKTVFFYDLFPSPDWVERVQAEKKQPVVEWVDGHPVQKEPCTISTASLGGTPVIWIPHGDLLDMGYRHLEDFDVVYVNGLYWELQAFYRGIGCWWVEGIDAEASAPDYPPEA